MKLIFILKEGTKEKEKMAQLFKKYKVRPVRIVLHRDEGRIPNEVKNKMHLSTAECKVILSETDEIILLK